MKNSLTMKFYAFFFGFLFLMIFPANSQKKSHEKLEQMIKTNALSTQNPIYKIPSGTKSKNTFLTSVTTSGKAVQKPLSYFCQKKPKNHYINFSRSATLLQRGKLFDLKLTANKKTQKAYLYAFADWDRDGKFETLLGEVNFSKKNDSISRTKLSITIPKKAHLGKTRIRVILKNKKESSLSADNRQENSYIYDFVVFITEKNLKNENH